MNIERFEGERRSSRQVPGKDRGIKSDDMFQNIDLKGPSSPPRVRGYCEEKGVSLVHA
jgi:hypothetical protein